MNALVLTVVVAAALAALARYLHRRHLVDAVERVPGPPAYPLLGNGIDFWKVNFNVSSAFDIWTKKYGDIFRIWLGTKPFIVLSKPEDVEIILGSSQHTEKSEVYAGLVPWVGEGLLTSNGNKWRSHRKLLTPTFHFRILDQFVEVFHTSGSIFVKKLLDNKEPIEVHSLLSLCTLDIICETAMGTKVEAQNNRTSPYVTAVHTALGSFTKRTMKPWLQPNILWNLSSEGNKFNNAVTVLHKYTNDVISSRRKERDSRSKDSLKTDDDGLGIKKRQAFLDLLLDANDTGANLSDSDIRAEVDTFMLGGHDTTAAALSYIMYNVAAHPEVQRQLHEEMDGIFGDSDRPATIQDIQSMNYSERVVKESLRLYPSAPLFSRKLHQNVMTTGGYEIPAGANVTISCFEMGRNAKHWPDPEKFDPDRHLAENSAGRHPYAAIPFSAGPRNCIGQKFAMMEMKTLLSLVTRQCQLSLPSPDYKIRVEGQSILRAPEGVYLRVAPYGGKA